VKRDDHDVILDNTSFLGGLMIDFLNELCRRCLRRIRPAIQS